MQRKNTQTNKTYNLEEEWPKYQLSVNTHLKNSGNQINDHFKNAKNLYMNTPEKDDQIIKSIRDTLTILEKTIITGIDKYIRLFAMNSPHSPSKWYQEMGNNALLLKLLVVKNIILLYKVIASKYFGTFRTLPKNYKNRNENLYKADKEITRACEIEKQYTDLFLKEKVPINFELDEFQEMIFESLYPLSELLSKNTNLKNNDCSKIKKLVDQAQKARYINEASELFQQAFNLAKNDCAVQFAIAYKQSETNAGIVGVTKLSEVGKSTGITNAKKICDPLKLVVQLKAAFPNLLIPQGKLRLICQTFIETTKCLLLGSSNHNDLDSKQKLFMEAKSYYDHACQLSHLSSYQLPEVQDVSDKIKNIELEIEKLKQAELEKKQHELELSKIKAEYYNNFNELVANLEEQDKEKVKFKKITKSEHRNTIEEKSTSEEPDDITSEDITPDVIENASSLNKTTVTNNKGNFFNSFSLPESLSLLKIAISENDKQKQISLIVQIAEYYKCIACRSDIIDLKIAYFKNAKSYLKDAINLICAMNEMNYSSYKFEEILKGTRIVLEDTKLSLMKTLAKQKLEEAKLIQIRNDIKVNIITRHGNEAWYKYNDQNSPPDSSLLSVRAQILINAINRVKSLDDILGEVKNSGESLEKENAKYQASNAASKTSTEKENKSNSVYKQHGLYTHPQGKLHEENTVVHSNINQSPGKRGE